MKSIIILAFITFVVAWDYLLFVQVWPGSWINDYRQNCLIDEENYMINDFTNFNNTYFTIHGLWPEYYNASWPEFCNKDKFNFTAIQSIRKYLEIYWTNFRNNPQSLWIHEYQKHASCAKDDPLLDTEYEFFLAGLRLREKYNLFNILEKNYIVPSNNIKYPTNKIITVLNSALNYTVTVICNCNNILNEIRICLDKDLNQFNCPSSELKEQCKNNYIIYNLVQ